MSKGQFQLRIHSGGRALGRCKSKGVENIEIIDVDKGKNDVVIIDASESSHQGSVCSRDKSSNGPAFVIRIDDEDDIDDTDSNAGPSSSSNRDCPVYGNRPFGRELDKNECQMFLRKDHSPSNLNGKGKMHLAFGSPRSHYGLYSYSDSSSSESDSLECGTSENDSSDCEIMEDFTGIIREQWERAALKRKLSPTVEVGSEDRATASGSSGDPEFPSTKPIRHIVDLEESTNDNYETCSEHLEGLLHKCRPSCPNNGVNLTHNMTNGNQLNADHFLGTNRKDSPAESDMSNGVSCAGLSFHKEKSFSESNLPGAQFFGTHIDHDKASPSDIQMQDRIPSSVNGFIYAKKAETVSLGNSLSADAHRVETNFHGEEGICSGQPPKAQDGKHSFSDNVGFYCNKDDEDFHREEGSPGQAPEAWDGKHSFSDGVGLHNNKDDEDCHGEEGICPGQPPEARDGKHSFSDNVGFYSNKDDEDFHSEEGICPGQAPKAWDGKHSFSDGVGLHNNKDDEDFHGEKGICPGQPPEAWDGKHSFSDNVGLYSNNNDEDFHSEEGICPGQPSEAWDGKHSFSDCVGLHNNKDDEDFHGKEGICPGQAPEAWDGKSSFSDSVSLHSNKEDENFHGEGGKCPGQPPEAWDGKQSFSNSVSLHNNKEDVLRTQSPDNSPVDHEVIAEAKEKSFMEQMPPLNKPLHCEPEIKHESDCFSYDNEDIHGESTSKTNGGSGASKRDFSLYPDIQELSQSKSAVVSDLEKHGDYMINHNVSQVQNDIIGDREKHKESDEYKHAEEEEWASRRQELQIQAEEAQRLRKKRKAENLHLDMEKRQKQRVEEIRESQRKEGEIINLKEHFRAEIRKDLDKVEGRYKDMASLLRGLGIHVKGGPFPLLHEVNAAYKQALLRFHPDRASRTDIRQQVEAEETFKMISRLKEKLLPVA